MRLLFATLTLPAAVLLAAPAQADLTGGVTLKGPGLAPVPADANSYQQYIRDNQINLGIMAMTPGSEMEFGLNACNYLRSGMTVDQVIPMGWNTMADNAALVNAAQRELCPDTLR